MLQQHPPLNKPSCQTPILCQPLAPVYGAISRSRGREEQLSGRNQRLLVPRLGGGSVAHSVLHAVKFSPEPQLELQPEYINLQSTSSVSVSYQGLELPLPVADDLTSRTIQLSRWLITTIKTLCVVCSGVSACQGMRNTILKQNSKYP